MMSWIFGLVAGVSLLPALHVINVGAGLLIRRNIRRRLARRSRGVLVFTYDDGPGERLEARLLELFAEYGERASFFLLALRAEGRQERVQALEDAGHEIAGHSFAHLDAFKTDPSSVARDMRRADAVFSDLGITTPSFRPPYGRLTLLSWLQLRREGKTIVMWTHVCGDTADSPPPVSALVDAVRRDGGGVVLLHSHDRTASRIDFEDYVMDATRELLELARTDGLEVIRACELTATIEGGRRDAGAGP